MQKYDFGNGRNNGCVTDFTVKINAAYIFVAVNSKTFIIQSRYSVVALFLHYVKAAKGGN